MSDLMVLEYMQLLKDEFIAKVNFHPCIGSVDYYTGNGGYFKFKYYPPCAWDNNQLYLPFTYKGAPVIIATLKHGQWFIN